MVQEHSRRADYRLTCACQPESPGQTLKKKGLVQGLDFLQKLGCRRLAQMQPGRSLTNVQSVAKGIE
jgi:hypothetical protein